MKKHIYKGIVGLASLSMLLTVSCSDDFTNNEPISTPTDGNYWKTAQDAVQASNALYSEMQSEETFSRGFFWYLNASDDIVTGRIRAGADNIKNFFCTGDEGEVSYMYAAGFRIIRRANDIIAKVPSMDIDAELKDRIVGEAYFMRAFNYFWLASTYGDNGENGGIPIITEANMNAGQDTFTRPASVINNYEQIVSDLQQAAELLPLITEMDGSNYGRAHRDAAYAYMAKTYLYWAQYDASKYQDVVTYCDAVTNSGSGRALIDTDTPSEDYRLLHSHLNNWTSEYIWSVNSGLQSGSKLPGILLENSGWSVYNGWGYYQPTNELYEAFEANDPRRDVTVLTFGDEFQYFGETRRYYSENSLSGFQFNKYMYEFRDADALGSTVNTNGDSPNTTYNVPLMRYAEVLLMKSEALIMQGQNGDAPLNLVRDRAGLSPITGATMSDLKHERRVELAGEFANRHFDLVRWGDAQEVYSHPLHGKIHTDRSNPDSPYTIEEIWPARNFDPSYMNVWPLPTTVISNSVISQNHDW